MITTDTFPSLFWSYTAIWAVLVVYVVFLAARLSKIEKELEKDEERGHDDGIAGA